MKEIQKIAFCSLIAAISVVLMFFCAVIPFFDFSILGICGVLIFILTKEFGIKKASLTYFVVSILSVLFVLDKFIAMCYVLFLGYYPILKWCLENSKKFVLNICLKPLLFVSIPAIVSRFLNIFLAFDAKLKILEYLLMVLVLSAYDIFLFIALKYYEKILRPFLFRT